MGFLNVINKTRLTFLVSVHRFLNFPVVHKAVARMTCHSFPIFQILCPRKSDHVSLFIYNALSIGQPVKNVAVLAVFKRQRKPSPYTWEKIQMTVFHVVAVVLMVEAASISETSVEFYQTTRRNNNKTAIFINAAVTTLNLPKKIN
jgi:hypothetical protein